MKILLVAMIILGVVTMSVVPRDHGTGSYQSVNGPTTVFQGLRTALLLMLQVAAAGQVLTRRVVSADHARATDHSDLSCTMLC